MDTPTHIRVFAVTDGSDSSRLALEYTKALMGILRVRVIPAAAPGMGMGIWPGYEALLKPIDGAFINCVACAPDQWCRTLRLEVPAKSDPFVGDRVTSSWEVDGSSVTELAKKKPEVLVDTIELWTANYRNILFPTSTPKSQPQLESAKRYDAIVVPNQLAVDGWWRHGIAAKAIPLPVADLVHKDLLFRIVTGRN